MKNWKQKKGIRRRGDSSEVVITKYTVSLKTATDLKQLAPTYGSQGRALQVATEMLIRMADLPKPEPQAEDGLKVRLSVRLRQRTHELIHELKAQYGDDPGQVIAACMKVLKKRRIK